MASTVQFVDSITTGPAVRLDLNSLSGPFAVAADGIDLSPPPLRRAMVSSMLADGERITASAYGNRTIKLPLRLSAATADAAAEALHALAMELVRPANILRLQLDGASQPVFFRTFAAPDYTLTMLRLLLTANTVVELEIPAEPFAYGPKETLPPVTVSNNPAASNGCYMDITGVKGDVETPLFATLVGSFSGGNIPSLKGVRRSLLAVRRRGNPAAMPSALQAEAMSQGTGVTVQPNDPTASGSGSNFSRINLDVGPGGGGNSLTSSRLSANWPPSPSVDARGTYQVWARVRHTTATDTFQLRLTWGTADALVAGDVVTVPADGGSGPNWWYVDLGQIQVPAGAAAVTDGYSGVETVPSSVLVAVGATRTGTGTLDVDCLLFSPADDRSLLVLWTYAAPLGGYVLDGRRTAVYGRDGTGQVASAGLPQLAGDAPMLSPSVTNRIVFVRDVGSGAGSTQALGVGDDITASTTITPYYWPRYLHVRGAS